MYSKNKIVGRAEHNVLVSSRLGEKAGEETSSLWRISSWPTGKECFHGFWMRRDLGKGQTARLVEKV